MVEKDYEKKYLEKKKKLKEFHKNLKNSKEIQELYHKIMGTNVQEEKYETPTTEDVEMKEKVFN